MKLSEIKITTNMRNVNAKEVENLKASIQTIGLLQPLLINQNNELIAGRHRYEALKELGYEDVPAMKVKGKHESLTDDEHFLLCQVDENLVRSELEPIIRAKAIATKKRLLEKILGNSREAVEQIQRETGLSTGTIYTDVKIAENIDDNNVDESKNKSRKELLDEIVNVNPDKIFKQELHDRVKLPSYYVTLKQISTKLSIDINRLSKEVDHSCPIIIQKIWQDELPNLINQIKRIENQIEKIIKNGEKEIEP